MRLRHHSSKRSLATGGFTLVEMLMVVAIIGILVTVGTPFLWKEIARAKRREATLTLSSIYRTQLAYSQEAGRFADDFVTLGFQVPNGVWIDNQTIQGKYYTYTMSSLTVNGRAGANFQAVATGDIDPRDATLDIVIIENNLTIVR